MDPIGVKRPTQICKQYSLSDKFKTINNRDSGKVSKKYVKNMVWVDQLSEDGIKKRSNYQGKQ